MCLTRQRLNPGGRRWSDKARLCREVELKQARLPAVLSMPLLLSLLLSLLVHLWLALTMLLPWLLEGERQKRPPLSAPERFSVRLHPPPAQQGTEQPETNRQKSSPQKTAEEKAAAVPSPVPLPQEQPRIRHWQLAHDSAITDDGTATDYAVFDPQLRHRLQQARRERAPVRQSGTVQRFDYGSGQEMIRVGEHCFLFTAADALDENSYDIWSPESCPPE